MGVSDYGTGGDKTNAPQLAAWAASVAAALNNSDVTVDDRIADAIADGSGSPEGVVTSGVGGMYTDTTNGRLWVKRTGTGNTGWAAQDYRITRPNTDDRLVEAWNGSAWSVVDYNSGWRDISGLITGTVTIAKAWLRRTTTHIDLLLEWSGLTGDYSVPLSVGFRPAMVTVFNVMGVFGDPGGAKGGWQTTGGGLTIDVRGDAPSASLTLPAQATLPSSLPGTLVSAAPA